MEYAKPYAFDLTDAQYTLLRGLVARAVEEERARAERMGARPPGTHSRGVLDAAAVLRYDLRELEAAIESGNLTAEPAA